jgi:hypothetical protein
VGPRFALPDNVVDSFYPPRGYAVRAEVVPHMVFKDPTLPWERPASSVVGDDAATNTVPWLAVLLFTQDELRLSSSDLSTMFAATSLGTGAKQSDTLTINMLAAEIPKIKNAASAVLYDPDADGADAKTDLIFLPSALFNSVFTHYDAQGKATPSQTHGWVYPHRFLAHLRHIHLDGTATAATTDDDTHTYSIVVGHRGRTPGQHRRRRGAGMAHRAGFVRRHELAVLVGLHVPAAHPLRRGRRVRAAGREHQPPPA